MAKGGARPGAGRKAGGKEKPHISDYWTKKQVTEFFTGMFERQKTDGRIAVWCGDQLSGKAMQPLTGERGGPIEVTVVKYAENPAPLPLRA